MCVSASLKLSLSPPLNASSLDAESDLAALTAEGEDVLTTLTFFAFALGRPMRETEAKHELLYPPPLPPLPYSLFSFSPPPDIGLFQ